jgi:polar amino acid transport system substrate-binding protein
MRRCLVLSVAAAVAAAPNAGKAAQPFRVCADPDNLPFSSSAPGTPGLYVELGQELARTMGRDFEPVWTLSYFGRFAVRTTLLAGQCDAYIGLPASSDFMGARLKFSQPFAQIGYALVLPAGVTVGSLDDLKGKRVAVQFGTTPQVVLADRDDITASTFLSPEEAMQALVKGEADAAFVWGPSAGYVNQTKLRGAFHVVPVQGPGMQWPVAIAVARGHEALRGEINQALDADREAVHTLLAKYGFPSAEPVSLASNTAPAAVQLVAAQQPAAADPAEVAAGKEIFNGTCAHCHGTDAVQATKNINLRLLHHRYGDRMDQVFFTTVENGRPAKGMPPWKGVFSQQDFTKILAFLKTVQTD